MSIRHTLIKYILVFFILSVILKITGVIETSILELSGYVLILAGISTVYLSFGRDKKAALFIGTVLFLTGVIFFLTGSFDFINPAGIIIPSFMFIAGAGFLMLFIDDPVNGIVLIIVAAAFFILGISSTIITGTVDIQSFLKSVLAVGKKYWVVVLIIIAVLFFLRKEKE